MEEFRNIKGYSELQVSNLGNVKGNVDFYINIKRGRRYVSFNGNTLLIAPLVAQAFPEICGEFFYGCNVHHIKPVEMGGTDNAENLRVLTQAEHIKIHKSSSKAVQGFYLGQSIGVFDSHSEAERKTGCQVRYISQCCKGRKPKNSKFSNYDWKYAA